MIRYNGDLHEAEHEPLITRRLFEQVQAVPGRKSEPGAPRLKPYLYRGVFRCGECGCSVTTETQKGHNYLRWAERVKKDCSQPYVRGESVNQQVARALGLAALPADWADRVAAELEAGRRQGARSAEAAAQGLRDGLKEAEGKVDRLTDAYLEDTLSPEESRRLRTGWSRGSSP